MNQETIVVLLYVFLAGGLANITSFPPKLPGYVIQMYDYPIIRVILLALISGIGLYVPEIAVLLAIGYGIVGEDIIKTSRISKDEIKGEKSEGFLGSEDGKEKEKEMGYIQLLPGPSDMIESREIASKKTASIDGIQNTLRSLQIQIQSMIPNSGRR